MHLVTVATDEPHELHVGHNVYTKINPGLSSSFSLEYNDFNRRIKLMIKMENFHFYTAIKLETFTVCLKIRKLIFCKLSNF